MIDTTKKDDCCVQEEQTTNQQQEEVASEHQQELAKVRQDYEALVKEFDECKQDLEQTKDRYLRCASDYQNYKQRVEKERGVWTVQAQGDVLRELLAICDDFDRALQQDVDENSDIKQWRDGFIMIHKALGKMLAKFHVTEIEASGNFDPELHEALMRVDSEDHEPGQIVQVLQKGFMHKDRVLRPAKVSVAKD